MQEPIRFPASGRDLVGIHHVPAPENDLRHGALLCNPFGQEAIRCHRLMKVLADRLAQAGLHVLRFDYAFTGDSEGDDADATLAAWIEDVRSAREALEQRAGVRGTSWFGLRLGGTLAMLASARGRGVPERLVVWDPMVDGAGYLAELARAHTAALETKFQRRVPAPSGRLREALGFPLPDSLYDALHAIVPADFAGTRAARVHLLESPQAEGIDALHEVLKRGPARVARTAIASRIVWASDEAMNSSIVPTDALQAVVEAFTEAA